MPEADAAPLVRVLLATCNAEPWLDDQLGSIANQQGVRVRVLVSDDRSEDGTLALLERWRSRLALQVLPPPPERLGNANRAFVRLIHECPADDCGYIALSDHDDIWLPGKLARAVAELERTGAQAYSSNVIAFWPDGRELLLVKSQSQRRFDHLFESAGPGCTFVFTRAAFAELQAWVAAHFQPLQAIKVHDWLLYAFARQRGWRWHIDHEAFVRYRQHERNEAGANVGWRAARRRWSEVRRGKFRRDALAIAAVVGLDGEVVRRLERLRWSDRLRLAALARQCRRTRSNGLVLALSFLVMQR